MQDELRPSHLCTALMRIGTRMAAIFDQQFAALGLTQAQFRVLLAIAKEGGEDGIAPSLLADHLLIERATVSVLTARLIARGLLCRRSGDSRRTFQLALTSSGQLLLQEALPHAKSLAAQTLAAIAPAEIDQTLTLLDRLEAHLRTEDMRRK